MNKQKILGVIPKEGKIHIRKVKKRLDQLLEITQCIKCKERKPLSEFAEDKDGYLGFSNVCQVCSDKIDYSHTMNKCENCGEFKSYDEFYKYRNSGYFKYCIECTKKVINEKATAGFTKKCTRCCEIKPASTEFFYITITCNDLLKPVCKVCDNKRKRDSKIHIQK